MEESAPKSRRFWHPRFGLRTAFVLVTVVCVWLTIAIGWNLDRMLIAILIPISAVISIAAMVALMWLALRVLRGKRRSPTVVVGPEAKDVVSHIDGHVVYTGPRGEIAALSLPAMQEFVVRPGMPANTEFFPAVHALSGPDAEGRVAFIDDHFFTADEKDRKHSLKTIRMDGREETEIFSRPGSVMGAESRAGKVGTHLALAPRGDKVAFLTGLSPKQMPGEYHRIGSIEIWDVSEKTRCAATATALDQAMSWFPEGNRLLYVKLVRRAELPTSATGPGLGDYFKTWDAVPAIHLLNVATGESSFLQVGRIPVISPDGKNVLIGGPSSRSEFEWRVFDMAKGESTRIEFPGSRAFARPTRNIALYWGFPTAGAPIGYTKHNSPLCGPKQMLSIKAAEIDSAKFQTVIPLIDPRTRISFGHELKST